MGLSRLENFLKSSRGTILYVDPSSLDSTDSIENSGNSLTRPFKTIQRALIEAARFSYQRGLSNDRFNKTTILLYPGDHVVDNRPGYIPTPDGKFSTRSGATEVTNLTQWSLNSNFDIINPNNDLYKINSVHGGVIVPRGTSIVGMDLRKTKIRPLYVPDPQNNNIERSCVFRVTGGCYFWQFTILDADPNGSCYKNYTSSLFVPNFSHHKLTGFEYADGVNGVYINDAFLNGGDLISTTRTDLDMYYEKVGVAYGPSSGIREIENDYPSSSLDIQPVIDEYRIVGSLGSTIGISSIRAGNGETSSTTITVDFVEPVVGLNVDTPIQISGVNASGYDGQYVVYSAPSNTQITYKVQNPPINPLPETAGSTLNLVVDTVTSASPYIFNISLRSVYGMCGLLADGDKATGFKSMVVAQYTGIGIQKDDNAFVKYDTNSGEYRDSLSIVNLHTDSEAKFKPEYENFHIKATNDAFLQLVSVFAIGYANHFISENGGDIAINNSNSNFGAKSLVSKGFKRVAFPQDDYGYITHIIPPKELDSQEISVEFNSLDVGVTTERSSNAETSTRLYLYNETNENIPSRVVIDGYHVGAKQNETLNVEVIQSGITSIYSSRIVMPDGSGASTLSSSEKVFSVARNSGGNIINIDGANIVTLTQNHSLINGESIIITSDNGHLPDGLDPNQIYYAITTGVNSNQIKIAKTLNNAINGSALNINNRGGRLSIISRVSDKNSGDIGHPVQWDTAGYWYINVDSSNNKIYDAIKSFGVSNLGSATPRTYVTRKPDSRSLIDTLYRVRYVLPKDSPTTARPPLDGFILQESNSIIGLGDSEISQLFSNTGSISDTYSLRNTRFIANASWTSNTVTIRTELPHDLDVGDEVEIVNISPDGYNGTYLVSSIISKKEFKYNLTSNPGVFANNTSIRTESLPYFRKKKYKDTYQVYRTQEVQQYIENIQDGVYYLTIINCSNRPTVEPFSDLEFSQPIENLYPQTNLDNPNSNPEASTSHALPDLVGKVVIDDPQNSITKKTLESFIVGTGITDIRSSSGIAHTIFTSVDHGLSGITNLTIVSSGSNYGSGFSDDLYNAQLVGFAGSTTGSNATAKISINGSGAITAIKIIDGGSAYGIGNTLRVVGVATTSNHVVGVVRVQAISNNIDDVLKVSGVSSASNASFNTLYRVSSVDVGKPKEINVVSSESISAFSTTGLGVTASINSQYIPSGKALLVSSFEYDPIVGLATVTLQNNHNFKVDNKIQIGGANQSEFNGEFIVERVNSLTQLVVNVGLSVTTSTNASGTLHVYRPILTSYGGDLLRDTENSSGRLNYQYAGITTVLGTQYTINQSDSTTNLNIPNAISLGFNLGDYILINDEIFRIRSAVNSNSVAVRRSVLGSPRQTHIAGAAIYKIKVYPVELRRNSTIRASGHTFEYLGYGPGNYSTSLPNNQDRVLSSDEKYLAQATKISGGIVAYTGMDSEGSFYAGSKKINSTTGQEEVYDTPIPTITGEKLTDNLVNITETQKLFVTNSVKIEGGKDKNIISEFDGPVVFNKKVTLNSDIEANSIFLQGDENVSRKITISSSIPDFSGNYGDVVLNSAPKTGENSGWIYTTDNLWKPYGLIGSEDSGDLYGVGVSTGGGVVGFSTLINFVANGISLARSYNSASRTTTLTFTGSPSTISSTGISSVGISSGGLFKGNVNGINFVGDSTGFGINVDARVSSTLGFGTITFRNPVKILNFETNILGKNTPKFTTRSIGSRLVYENSLNSTNVDYATGVTENSLWNSIPRNTNSLYFKWYGGETEIASLSGTGNLVLTGSVTAPGGFFGSFQGEFGGDVTGDVLGNASSANQIKTESTGVNLNHFITFVDSNNSTPTNEVLYTDAGITYNPSTNILTTNLSGNATSADLIKTQSRDTNANHFVTFVDSNNSTPVNESLYTAGGLTYNPATNILNANISGGAQSAIVASTLNKRIIAGAGLTALNGIDSLSLLGGDITLDVQTGDGIQISNDSVAVDPLVVVRTTGDQSITGSKKFVSPTLFSGNINALASTTNSLISVTQNGTGYAFVVNDQLTDRSPFVINRDGDCGIGTLATGGFKLAVRQDAGTSPAVKIQLGTTSSTAVRAIDFRDRNNVNLGEIICNTVANTTSYITVSDYRLKENVVALEDAIIRLKNLKPSKFNFISDPEKVVFDGFIAHEVQEVVPQAVSGNKDELDEDGSIKSQGIDYGKLVPLLTAALQESIAKIEMLEKRIQTLEEN